MSDVATKLKTATAPPAIVFDDVWKYYPMYQHITGGIKLFLINLPSAIKKLRAGRFYALKGLSFEVSKGEVVGIYGPNGAGKSTALSLIAGVMRPSNGRIKVSGRVAPLLELGAGFQHDLTGRENVVLNGVLLGMTRAEVQSQMDSIIAFADLGEFIDQPIRTYSSGMMARLGFAVAVHTNPDILLVDEILAVGDESFQKKCYAKMAEFKRGGVTIVLVSHDRATMERFCDRIIEVAEGRFVRSVDYHRVDE